MGLEIITVSEISQTSVFVISLTCEIWKKNGINEPLQNRDRVTDVENKHHYQGRKGRGITGKLGLTFAYYYIKNK